MRLLLKQRQPPLLISKPDHYRLYTIYTPDLKSGSYYHLDHTGFVDLVTVKDHLPTSIVRISDHFASHNHNRVGDFEVLADGKLRLRSNSVVTTTSVVPSTITVSPTGAQSRVERGENDEPIY